MERLKQNMINIYYNNLESHAKKNKIEINLPKTNIQQNYDDNTFTPTLTEEPATETNLDDFMYKKPWNKLNIIHKIIKMKEFVNELNIEDTEMKKHLKTQLVTMLKNKKLTKKSDVDYDAVNGKIITVHSLQCKNNTYNLQ
jgi:hypothetical protein